MRYALLFFSIGLALFAAACTPKSTEAIPGKVTGVIKVSPELEASLKSSDVLYIIARGYQSGPPSAVKRVVKPQFPLKYVIGPEDAMIPGTPGFESGGQLTMSARISRSGAATPTPGDLDGVYVKNPASAGDSGVDIVIDKIRN